MKTALLLLALTLLGETLGSAQVTTWNNVAGNSLWNSPGNWSTGAAPTQTSAVQIGTDPTSNYIGIDEGGGTAIIASFEVLNTITTPFSIFGLAGDSLQVNGNITNSGTGSATPNFGLPVLVGADSTWSGYLQFSNIINLQTHAVTISAAPTGVNFVSGANLSFAIASASTYGRFLGAAPTSLSGVNITIALDGYTATLGDTFNFLGAGGFTGSNINALPALDAGLTWDSTSLISNGTLSVIAIPEPATWALLAGGLGSLLVFRRRAGRAG